MKSEDKEHNLTDMESLTGKKIFVLYPDEKIRNIFYGQLRNQFAVYYIYDYEKIRQLAEYYPSSIVVINLVDNELEWLPEEISSEIEGLSDDARPETIAIYDKIKPQSEFCSRSIQFLGDDKTLRAELYEIFIQLNGKGRRNFVRLGGSGEEIALMKITSDAGEYNAIAHDMSSSGLSCSIIQTADISKGESLTIRLSLEGKTVELRAEKILERSFGETIIHVLKFSEPMSEDSRTGLLNFIYSSLDSKMHEFIKNLSI
ncbi:MAG: PilZ domain-containing protein [Spirochaetales bacterium]|uniref:PilZ domain-containing protein n=1 Tax=Candidatus Thalassospirochaeta sargassi TaxID=3119039 RepID=A0AAJ1IFC0_9SPIO|nr:PilZ domain-containing protein [Spirochaetales bacterium]